MSDSSKLPSPYLPNDPGGKGVMGRIAKVQVQIAKVATCRVCSLSIEESVVTCPKCGTVAPARVVCTKNRYVCATLAIVLGSFGVHRFYIGQSGYGLIYAAFYWTYIPGILGVIEGLRYILMPQHEFESRYG